MSNINTGLGLVGGVGATTMTAAETLPTDNILIPLLVGILPVVIGIIADIVCAWLRNKKVISSSQENDIKENIDEIVEDITEGIDGK